MLRASKWIGASALLFWFAACAAAQATATKVNDQEASCSHYLEMLKADHAAGLTCSAAKARADSAEPGCKLVFTCKD